MNISPTTLVIVSALIGAGFSLLGVIVNSLFNLRTTRLAKESEERRHQREIVINAAIENWKQQMEQYKIHQQPMNIVPLDVYIVHMLKFSELFLNGDVTPANIREKSKEVEDLTLMLIEHKKERGEIMKQRRT